jgi:hypothetical protein
MNIAKTFHRVANAVIYPIVSELDRLIRIGKLQHDLLLRSEWRAYVASAKNPLNKCGRKYFSQADEDGITLEILRRIDARSGTFAEIGVGNGLENNTLILLAAGEHQRVIQAGKSDEEVGQVREIGSQALKFHPSSSPV